MTIHLKMPSNSKLELTSWTCKPGPMIAEHDRASGVTSLLFLLMYSVTVFVVLKGTGSASQQQISVFDWDQFQQMDDCCLVACLHSSLLLIMQLQWFEWENQLQNFWFQVPVVQQVNSSTRESVTLWFASMRRCGKMVSQQHAILDELCNAVSTNFEAANNIRGYMS